VSVSQPDLLETLDFDKGGGVITVVAQDAITGGVLMVALGTRESVERTLATGEMHYFSRRRGLWHKGATSGNTQRVVSLTADCDGDTLLALVESRGPACHTGAVSCFNGAGGDAVSALDRTLAERAAGGGSGTSYTRRLLADRNLRLKKLGEEMAELVAACADGDREKATEEGADVVYHTLVALRALGVGVDDVRRVLERRAAPPH
jgi:phosphoribosyl-AMP cyclohydrolase / phosphoribosyl-ATP pyrophosphohydrolase